MCFCDIKHVIAAALVIQYFYVSFRPLTFLKLNASVKNINFGYPILIEEKCIVYQNMIP